MEKITPCLWFDGKAEEAARFYTSVFKKSKMGAITRYGEGMPGKKGSVMTVTFEIEGQEFMGLNGGPQFKFSEAVSFVVHCKTQKQVDRYWDRLLKGGKPSQCGWLTDKFGLSWQIVPTVLSEDDEGQGPREDRSGHEGRARDDQARHQGIEEGLQGLTTRVAPIQPTAIIPFVPGGKDFGRSRRLFRDLGFEEVWENGGYAGFRAGGAQFILQDFDQPGFADNMMIRIDVADLDRWWAEVQKKALPAAYPEFRIKPPQDFPWGREVHFIDLAGVCWHVGQPQDLGRSRDGHSPRHRKHVDGPARARSSHPVARTSS